MKTLGSPALLDTNVLVHSVFPSSPNHISCRSLLDAARASAEPLYYVTSQILGEFHSVVTSPKRVKEPRTCEESLEAIEQFHAITGLGILPVPIDHSLRWVELAREHSVTRGAVFDLHHVATMLGNNIHTIYTFNTDDFEPFHELIEIRNPEPPGPILPK